MKFIGNIALGIFLAGCVVSTTLADNPGNVKLVSETMTAHTGDDTVDKIADQYIYKNTGTNRQRGEFAEGILELNYDVLKDRPGHKIYPGDQIKVNYWVRE